MNLCNKKNLTLLASSIFYISGTFTNSAIAQNSLNTQDTFILSNKQRVVQVDLNTKELVVNLGYDNKNSSFLVEMLTSDGKAVTKEDFIPFKTGEFVRVNWLDTKLTKIHDQAITIDGINSVFSIKNLKKDKAIETPKCQAFYISYHLKNEPYVTTKALIFDKEGNSVSKIEFTEKKRKNCEVPNKLAKDTIDYSESGYIGGFSWSKPVLSINKPVGFNSVFKREGQDFTPEKLTGYAVSQDFSHFYQFEQKPSRLGSHFGIDFEQYITHPSTYYFVIEFKIDGKDEQISTLQSVLP